MKVMRSSYKAGVALGVALIIGVTSWDGASRCEAQTTPAVSPGLEEIVKLSKAQMGDDVILGYIKKATTPFTLTADDIVYLKDQGVSQPVIAALLQAKAATPVPAPAVAPVPAPAPAPAPASAPQPVPTVAVQPGAPPPAPPPGPPPGEVSFGYFHDQLAPFGAWINVGGVMYWRPDAALRTNPDFRPYYDMGKWVQTENGLFWQSDYVWGDIPFHYGRWVHDPVLGWLWLPEYEWGPAWVFWRHAEADGAIGWAPLPVGAVVIEGGYMWHGARMGLEFDFGMGEGVFVFVGYDHFHEGFFRMRGHEWAWHIHGDRFHDFYRRSVVRNEFHRDEHGRFVNHGIGRERLAAVTHNRVEHAGFEERKPVGDRNALAKGNEKAGEKPGEKTGEKAGEKAPASAAKPTASTASSGASSASKVYRPPTASASKPAASAPSSNKKK